MNNFKRTLFMLLALVMLISTLAACNGNEGETSSTESNDSTSNSSEEVSESVSSEEVNADGSYTVSIKTVGGIAMNGIDVFVYTDNSLTDLLQFGQTGEDGKVSLKLAELSADMVFVLSGVPNGYDVAEYYTFKGASTEIVLTSAPISDKNLSDSVLGVGDVMCDFTVTSSKGETITLSDVLKEKELVVLNFWYTTCSWCITEFPVINDVYTQYSDKVEVIAVDPLDGAAAVKSFAAAQDFAFPMADCPASWANSFSVQGYPTSVFIDRYGVICLIEAGAVTSNRPWVSAFEHFTGEDYKQTLCENINDLVTEILPTFEFEGSDAVANAISADGVNITYRPETEDENAKYYWPFITTEKDGEDCIYASNKGIESSYSILYADVELKKGQAIGFDYIISSEALCDILVVIVNDEDVYQISGVKDDEGWKACYPWVAEEDGVYELALCFTKDGDNNEGDDTVYIKNMRVIDSKDIDVATYIPRNAATLNDDGLTYDYVDIFFNEKDGYYHVGSVDGPLLLSDLMYTTQFNEEKSIWDILYNGEVMVDGKSYYDNMVKHFSYASNSSLNGICTVDKDLAEHLKIVASNAGFDGTDEEWLKTCKYFEVYGTDGEQLVDPIQGLAIFSAPEAVLGVGKEENFFYYDRVIMPRGMFKKFVPTKSGAYRITSHNESIDGVDAWIFDENGEIIYTYENEERMFNVDGECSMVYYMEAGVAYYISIAFWDMYQNGYIYFDVEYIAPKYDHFCAASPGYFTYDTGATGEDMYYTISGGIDVVLKDDGYYYHDLGLDANGKQIYGSLIYADFTGLTAVFSSPIVNVYAYNEDGTVIKDENGNPVEVKGMIELGGFDFSKTEDDLYILSFYNKNNNDYDATIEYLKKLWGESYDDNMEHYKVEDVLAGKYHGKGEDFTEAIKAFTSKIIKDGSEKDGCVPVNEELAGILQMLMDKYTFEGVEYSWLKVCYYYKYLGA